MFVFIHGYMCVCFRVFFLVFFTPQHVTTGTNEFPKRAINKLRVFIYDVRACSVSCGGLWKRITFERAAKHASSGVVCVAESVCVCGGASIKTNMMVAPSCVQS